jgi:hypothetical protein
METPEIQDKHYELLKIATEALRGIGIVNLAKNLEDAWIEFSLLSPPIHKEHTEVTDEEIIDLFDNYHVEDSQSLLIELRQLLSGKGKDKKEGGN